MTTLSAKYDGLLQRHMALEDQSCAKPKEANELDEMAARDPEGTDSALAIMITPAVWNSITRLLA